MAKNFFEGASEQAVWQLEGSLFVLNAFESLGEKGMEQECNVT